MYVISLYGSVAKTDIRTDPSCPDGLENGSESLVILLEIL